jgi:lipopolysaccharide export system protein LptA
MRLPLSLMLLACVPTAAWALPEDTKQSIHVQADTVEIDDRRGVSVYQGNVVLTQGSIILRADKLTVHHPQRQMEKAIAEGNPARYQQDMDTKGSQVKAQSSMMEYSATDRVLVLSGRAQVWQDGNQFNGSRIEYDLKTDVVYAKRGESAQERVEVTIQPSKRPSQ